MRHVPLELLLARIFATPEGARDRGILYRAHIRVAKSSSVDRTAYIERNGARKWSALKRKLVSLLGKKCWYSELELKGAHLVVDHFRPKSVYWWLAFEPTNYRISCPLSNTPEYDPVRGGPGGKGDSFPLLPPGIQATGRNRLKIEKPVILDPCKQEDCALLAFQDDGRPVINPACDSDPNAVRRFDESVLLLNLDHHDLNSLREQLYHDIRGDVEDHEEAAPGSRIQARIRERMRKRISPSAAFSVAANYYLRAYRHLDWVVDLLENSARDRQTGQAA